MNRVKNCVFLVRKWSYTTFNIVNIRKRWEKKGKIRRTRSMTKKRSSEMFTLKMEIFPEIGPRKKFLVPPQIRRQVSAHVRSSYAIGPERHVIAEGYMTRKKMPPKWKYVIGDKVRISNTKQAFKKGYLGSWSVEIFTIEARIPSDPVTYEIADLNGVK